MAKKVTWRDTGATCPVTGAMIVEMDVEVKGKKCIGTKRVFRTVEEVGALTDEECLKMVNYAEDLFTRAEVTSANTPKGEKDAERTAARKHWASVDIAGITAMFTTAPTAKAIADALDAYYAEHKDEITL